jgi:hypothetical protein
MYKMPAITPSVVQAVSADTMSATRVHLMNTDYHLNNIYTNTGSDVVHGNSYGIGGYQAQTFKRVGSNSYIPVSALPTPQSGPIIKEGMMSFSGTINNCGRNGVYEEGVT